MIDAKKAMMWPRPQRKRRSATFGCECGWVGPGESLVKLSGVHCCPMCLGDTVESLAVIEARKAARREIDESAQD